MFVRRPEAMVCQKSSDNGAIYFDIICRSDRKMEQHDPMHYSENGPSFVLSERCSDTAGSVVRTLCEA